MHPFYENRPDSYISHLLGHEGENSLLSVLIDEGLALELSSGCQDQMNLFSAFTVSIQLTQRGLQHYDRVCNLVFAYLHMLREQFDFNAGKPLPEWIFNEKKLIKQLSFDNKDKEKAMGCVTTLGSRLQNFPLQHILVAPFLMEKFRPDLIH